MLDFRQSLINSTLRKILKRHHYPLEVMLICVRWYVACPLSLCHIEEMIAKSAVFLWIASRFIAGIEIVHMIRKGQMDNPPDQPRPQQTSSMDRPSDHMSVNAPFRNRQFLMQQNLPRR